MTRISDTRCRDDGFTLLELLIVMALMVLLSTIMVTSYFGAQRAASYTASATDVRNALTFARQRACMNGKRTFLAFTNATDFIVVQPIGKISCIQGDYYYDGYTDMADNANAGNRTRLYNLQTFANHLAQIDVITMEADRDPLFKGQTVARITFYNGNDEVDSSGKSTKKAGVLKPPASEHWDKDVPYGVAVSTLQRLPKGFEAKFSGGDSEGSNHYVVFNPDGSVKNTMTIKIGETALKNEKNSVEVTIDTSGKIKVK